MSIERQAAPRLDEAKSAGPLRKRKSGDPAAALIGIHMRKSHPRVDAPAHVRMVGPVFVFSCGYFGPSGRAPCQPHLFRKQRLDLRQPRRWYGGLGILARAREEQAPLRLAVPVTFAALFYFLARFCA